MRQLVDLESRLAKLRETIRPSTIIDSLRLKKELGLNILIASESFQTTGSFKFRAAYNLAANTEKDTIITASSGNFGQALACACSMLGKKCIVVMPDNSAIIKIDSTKYWNARVDLVNTKVKPRAARVAELAAENPGAYIASAYDDAFVIEGNSSLGIEIGDASYPADIVIAPIGGGGLCSGIVQGLRSSKRPQIQVIAAEPASANDAAQSLAKGEIVIAPAESTTIADGARTLSLGKLNFEILKDGLAGIIEVREESIKEALHACFYYANLKLEPTGALSIAAAMQNRERFAGKNLVCVASGGNVDPGVFSQLLGF